MEVSMKGLKRQAQRGLDYINKSIKEIDEVLNDENKDNDDIDLNELKEDLESVIEVLAIVSSLIVEDELETTNKGK